MTSSILPAAPDGPSRLILGKRLPELITLEKLLLDLQTNSKNFGGVPIRINNEVTLKHVVKGQSIDFPVHTVVIGCEDPQAPTFGIFGGVHGLERIGSSVVIAYLQTVAELLSWDQAFRDRLKQTRLVFMPLVNPVGMCLTRRSNGNGVDLMRNAPVLAEEEPAFLLGGQRYSSRLPWYRGNCDSAETMEIEAKAVASVVEREIFPSRLSLVIDVHSGFGIDDRLWFPYARTRKAPPHIAEISALKRLFDRSYPNHFYTIEPQAKNYTTHGDLWDWLYDRHALIREPASSKTFIPWTLELGSWSWLKKNPRQAFSSLGAFNPGKPHRLKRTLRRHLTLFDFIHRALYSPSAWSELENDLRNQLLSGATDLWYE